MKKASEGQFHDLMSKLLVKTNREEIDSQSRKTPSILLIHLIVVAERVSLIGSITTTIVFYKFPIRSIPLNPYFHPRITASQFGRAPKEILLD